MRHCKQNYELQTGDCYRCRHCRCRYWAGNLTAEVQTQSDRLSLAGVGADGLPHKYTSTGWEAKGRDGAAHVTAHQQVSVGECRRGAYNPSTPHTRQRWVHG